MNNYYYIIAGLPDLSKDWVRGEKDADAILGEIKEQCSARDRTVMHIFPRILVFCLFLSANIAVIS